MADPSSKPDLKFKKKYKFGEYGMYCLLPWKLKIRFVRLYLCMYIFASQGLRFRSPFFCREGGSEWLPLARQDGTCSVWCFCPLLQPIPPVLLKSRSATLHFLLNNFRLFRARADRTELYRQPSHELRKTC